MFGKKTLVRRVGWTHAGTAKPYQDMGELMSALGWYESDDSTAEVRLRNLRKYHDDLTLLMGWSFTKLVGLITLLGLLLGFGLDALDQGKLLSATLSGVATVVATVVAVWAVMSRRKVWQRATDGGLAALSISTVQEEAWDMYQWYTRRFRTWRIIERGLWLVGWLTIATLAVFLWNLVPWADAYETVNRFLGHQSPSRP